MAGGGVGEAMLIGAAVGAGTGGIMSAAQDKDVGQGMLLGALGGAATGGIGSGIGGAAGSAAENIAANTVTDAALANAGSAGIESGAGSAIADITAQNAGAGLTGAEQTANILGTSNAGQGSQAAILQAQNEGMGLSQLQSNANIMDTITPGTTTPQASGPQTWGMQGKGEGLFPGMTNAQVAGASTTGGISGLMAANGQPAPYKAPETETYNGPLSHFKLAGPQLSQYSYDPNTFKPSVAPGYAEGGIASLAQGGVQQTGMFPQSQIDRMQFATPSQMPVSREIIGSDYDATTNPYTGDLPRFAEGGGINFIHNMQPGGEWGDMTADIYGAVQEHKPKWLQDIEPGGFIGATVPGKLDWEEKKRKEEEEKIAQDRAAKEAQAAAMYNDMAQQGGGMARGGIADLGSYSDGGRLLRGPGDGMSDNIPASIAGKQPARLADGEFVVPADVVSHLGNGSTDAGAKTLYSMMDKVRKARTGSKKQGREINPDKYVPGMAGGGIARLAEGGDTATIDNQAYTPSVYTPSSQYDAYTVANRPSSANQQFYGNIYRGETPDYSTPGYTLTGGSLGQWSNVAGEAQRAAQPASLNQQVTQDYLRTLGRAPDQASFNQYMQSGMTAPQIQRAISASPESIQRDPTNKANVNAFLANQYQSLLGRSPDQAGLDYWSGQISSGQQSPTSINRAIQGSPEFQVRQAYSDYLGRMPDTEGASYWSGRVGQGMTLDEMRKAIQGSAEGQKYSAAQKQKAYDSNPNAIKTQTVQSMIDQALAKYKEENPGYSPPSYSSDAGGGGSGGERAGGVIKSKRAGGIAALRRA